MNPAMLVRDIMTRDLVKLEPQMEILRAVHLLTRNGISGAPVVGPSGGLVGMLTERDCMNVLLHAAYHGEYGGRVAQFMSPQVEVIAPDAHLFDVARRFRDGPYRRFPVVEGGMLVGQISRSDVMQAMSAIWPHHP